MNRRKFLQLMGIAPAAAYVAWNPHRVYFDLGRKLFLPKQDIIIVNDISASLTCLNLLSQQYFKGVGEIFFTPSPVFWSHINGENDTATIYRLTKRPTP